MENDKKKTKRCVICTTRFMPKKRHILTCSPECSRKHHKLSTREWSKKANRTRPERMLSRKKYERKKFAQREGVMTIPLTHDEFAIVDAEDYQRIVSQKWSVSQSGKKKYATSSLGLMHRVILNPPKNRQIDHLNGDGLDNRKKNLRLATPLENLRNMSPQSSTSKFKGVSWNKDKQKWYVMITKDGKSQYVGSFDEEIDAALAYDKIAEREYGEFAWLNRDYFKEVQICYLVLIGAIAELKKFVGLEEKI